MINLTGQFTFDTKLDILYDAKIWRLCWSVNSWMSFQALVCLTDWVALSSWKINWCLPNTLSTADHKWLSNISQYIFPSTVPRTPISPYVPPPHAVCFNERFTLKQKSVHLSNDFLHRQLFSSITTPVSSEKIPFYHCSDIVFSLGTTQFWCCWFIFDLVKSFMNFPRRYPSWCTCILRQTFCLDTFDPSFLFNAGTISWRNYLRSV